MKKFLAPLLAVTFALFVPTGASAGWHHYSHRYYDGYRGHYSYPYSHRHHDYYLAPLGVGLITGAVIGSLLYQPPVERTVVYTQPPVIVQRDPVVIGPQVVYEPTRSTNEILRYVKPTVRLLNLRSGPGLDEEVVGETTSGEVLGVVGAAPDWLYVKTETGRYGWVMTRYTHALEGPVG